MSGGLKSDFKSRETYTLQLSKILHVVHDMLRDQQRWLRTQSTENHPCFRLETWCACSIKRTSKHKSAKLLPKFVGLSTILQIEDSHTYLITQNDCVSRKTESRLKTYYKRASDAGKAPGTEELNRRSTRLGGNTGQSRCRT